MKHYLKKFRLDGKKIYVTGGAGYLGAPVSQAVAAAGAIVIILDTNRQAGNALAEQIRKDGAKAYFEFFDITKLNRLDSAMKSLIKQYRGIDVWVNSAYPRTRDWYVSVEKMSLVSLQKNVDAHLNSYLWTSRVAALEMKRRKTPGAIVNFGSIYGVQANDFTVYEGTTMVSPIAYSAIKGGIVNVTRYLASYFGSAGIRANCICPGAMGNASQKQFVKNFSKKVPLKRLGKPEEVATAVLFLCSDAASYVNGSTLMVDGGWSIV